jgi:TolA-binding protein
VNLPSPLHRRLAGPAVALLALTCACTTTSARRPAAGAPGARTADVALPPEEVQVTRLDLELEGKNDEELFAIGMAADAAKDWRRAAAAFARIADRFPGSRHEATALFDAGLAYQALGEWRLALERFHAFVRGWEGPDALEAGFKIAECHYHLDDLDAAHAALASIAAQTGLPAATRVRVLAQMGVVELEADRPEEAERTLRRALAAWTSVGDSERLDPYYAAQAQYYLGEVSRRYFLAVVIDPSAGDPERLQEAIEEKAQLLLTAQGHYLRAIRFGDHAWAVASGSRVGELYDAFRQQLLEAPLPPGLSEEEQQAYRDLLRKRVRVLAAKAVTAYEAALGWATTQGISDEDVKTLADARQALHRLEEALREEATPQP